MAVRHWLAGLHLRIDLVNVRYRAAWLVRLRQDHEPGIRVFNVTTEPVLHGPVPIPGIRRGVPLGKLGPGRRSVASGILPGATPPDGGGTIRIPASCCGLVRPSSPAGRQSVGPLVGGEAGTALPGGHVITRSVRDHGGLPGCHGGGVARLIPNSLPRHPGPAFSRRAAASPPAPHRPRHPMAPAVHPGRSVLRRATEGSRPKARRSGQRRRAPGAQALDGKLIPCRVPIVASNWRATWTNGSASWAAPRRTATARPSRCLLSERGRPSRPRLRRRRSSGIHRTARQPRPALSGRTTESDALARHPAAAFVPDRPVHGRSRPLQGLTVGSSRHAAL